MQPTSPTDGAEDPACRATLGLGGDEAPAFGLVAASVFLCDGSPSDPALLRRLTFLVEPRVLLDLIWPQLVMQTSFVGVPLPFGRPTSSILVTILCPKRTSPVDANIEGQTSTQHSNKSTAPPAKRENHSPSSKQLAGHKAFRRTKHCVLAVQVLQVTKSDEKLRSICVSASIRH